MIKVDVTKRDKIKILKALKTGVIDYITYYKIIGLEFRGYIDNFNYNELSEQAKDDIDKNTNPFNLNLTKEHKAILFNIIIKGTIPKELKEQATPEHPLFRKWNKSKLKPETLKEIKEHSIFKK